MNRQERKSAIIDYKERAPARGVYAVICTATREAWVGHSNHVDTKKNGLWFALKLGGSPYPSLQEAWNCFGEHEFRFEELDRLRDDFPEFDRMDELKRRQALWRERLGARRL